MDVCLPLTADQQKKENAKINVTEHESETAESTVENFEMYVNNSLIASFTCEIADEGSWSLRIFPKNFKFQNLSFTYDLLLLNTIICYQLPHLITKQSQVQSSKA